MGAMAWLGVAGEAEDFDLAPNIAGGTQHGNRGCTRINTHSSEKKGAGPKSRGLCLQEQQTKHNKLAQILELDRIVQLLAVCKT